MAQIKSAAKRKVGRPKVLKGRVRHHAIRLGNDDEIVHLLRAAMSASGLDETTVHRRALAHGLKAIVWTPAPPVMTP